jgi:hypothetical protein
MKMNKRGDKLISVYWFAILFIVAGGIVYMVSAFYGNPYDVRLAEADILTTKIARCISEAGYLKEGVLTENFNENFAEICAINFQTEDVYDWRERGQYYVEVDILDFNTKQKISGVSEGNKELKPDCGLKGKTLPVCLERSFYSIDEEGNQYQINIISIVRKTEKNVQ